MARTLRRVAAWAAPILPSAGDPPLRRPRLAPLRCVLWLPDYGGYLKTIHRRATAFTVSQTPDQAMQFDEDQAEATGLDLAEAAGIRVHLRPFTKSH